MATPPRKKAKKEKDDDVDPIFHAFDKEEMVAALKDAVCVCESGHTLMNVCALYIRESNARSCANFTNASCDTEQYTENDKVVSYTVGSLFGTGLAVMKEYLNSLEEEEEDIQLPEDEQCREALANLLRFVYSYKSCWQLANNSVRQYDLLRQCAQSTTNDFKGTVAEIKQLQITDVQLVTLVEDSSERTGFGWSVQVAQHLLLPLIVESMYTLDDGLYRRDTMPVEKGFYVCPCESKDRLSALFADNSFGCPDAWHGTADIWMEDLTVTFVKEKLGHTLDYSDNQTELPAETEHDNFAKEDYEQMIATTIVSSFLQQSEVDQLDNCLIPSIGFCKNKVIVHFYDSVNDCLLKTAPLNLFIGKGILNMNTVVLLWLTLNYKLFCSGLAEEMKAYKANFYDRVGGYIDKYKHNIGRPLPCSSDIERAVDDSWADMSGKRVTNRVAVKFMKIRKM